MFFNELVIVHKNIGFRTFLLLHSLILLTLPIDAFSKVDFDFSGFGQVVVGQLDEKNAEYQGYDSSFSIKPHSLIGLQGELNFSDSLSVNAQVVGYANDDKKSGVEWLYLSYQPTDNFQIKIGKNKTPFFNYSDVENVGFAYHWTTPPQQVYNNYLFNSFDGIFVRYDIPNRFLNVNVEAYWGEYSDDYNIGSDDVHVDVNNLAGLIINGNFDGLSFRGSYNRGYVETQVPSLSSFITILEQANFPSMANQLSATGDFNFYQFGLSYEKLNYFVKTEITQIDPEVLIVPKTTSKYISIGYSLAPFVFHMTYAKSDAKYKDSINEIPLGISAQLDALHYGFEQVVQNTTKDDLTSYSAGVRWDWQTNIALKFDVTFLNAGKNQDGFFTNFNDTEFDRKATLTQLAITWVF
jgi:hypothetical protein